MSHSHTKIKIKLPNAIVAQCRDRAKREDISVSKLVKRAIAQYLTQPVNTVPTSLNVSGVSTADYARLVARVEQLEIQLAQLRLAPVPALPLTTNGSSVVPIVEDDDLENVDEPDEILYDFLEAPRSPA